jgi:hypothetical protein
MIKNYTERYLVVRATPNPNIQDVWSLMKDFKNDPKLQKYLAGSNQLEENFEFLSKMIDRVNFKKIKPSNQQIIQFYKHEGTIKRIKKSLVQQSDPRVSVSPPSVPVLKQSLEKSVPPIQPLRAPKSFERMHSHSLRSEAIKIMQHYPKECSHSKRLEMVVRLYFLLKELSDRYFYDVRQSQLPRYPNFSQDNAKFMVQLIEFTNQHTQQLSTEIGEIQVEIETISNPLNAPKIQLKLETAFVLLNADLSVFYLGLMNAGFVMRLSTSDIATLLFFHLSELQALKKTAHGGEEGIRTLGTLRYTSFPRMHDRPL